MAENRIEDFLRGDVFPRDPAARDRARVRLWTAIRAEETGDRPTFRRRWRIVTVAAALAALAILILQVALPPGGVGPTLGAAAEIRQLGRVAATQEPMSLRASDFIYSRTREVRREAITRLTEEIAFSLDITATRQTWLAADGSGQAVMQVEDVDFSSATDRDVWEAAGAPPIVADGDSDTEDYGRGELPVYAVENLPADPQALREALASGDVITPAEGDLNLLLTIGIVLGQQDLPGDVRQALFEVAATIQGITVEHDVSDLAGREAIALTLVDASSTSRLFFDPVDAHFLGQSETFPSGGDRPAFTDWRVYLETALVDDIGDRPS